MHAPDRVFVTTSFLDIYVDGSFDPASKRGGWAFVVTNSDGVCTEKSGHHDGETNNSFELIAALRAAEWADVHAEGQNVTIWSDSHHVVEGCNKWRPIWRNNRWKRYSANPKLRKRLIDDAELWERLDILLSTHPSFVVAWCKGHEGVAGNERADELASLAAGSG